MKSINGTLEVHFTLEQLRVFIYRNFELLCYVFPWSCSHTIQDTILNPPNPYLWRPTVLLDKFILNVWKCGTIMCGRHVTSSMRSSLCECFSYKKALGSLSWEVLQVDSNLSDEHIRALGLVVIGFGVERQELEEVIWENFPITLFGLLQCNASNDNKTFTLLV